MAPVEKKYGPVKEDIIAAAYNKQTVIRRQRIRRPRIVDGLILQPLFYKVQRE